MADIKKILSGNTVEGARMIRLIEDHDKKAFDLLKQLYPCSGSAFILGITGPPGAGKSTLIDGLIFEFRKHDFKIGVIAVDPTSPVSGGAVLGDRLRMQRHATDEHVFIRSMASRGQEGGLCQAAKNASIVLDAMGYDIIIIETVGAGQAQFDIGMLAHSIGIVTTPGSGDGIQAVKAGIIETGDIFIVNKCDRPDADQTVFELENMINMKNISKTAWKPETIKTEALKRTGVKELADTFLSCFDFMKKNNLMVQKRENQEKDYFNYLLKALATEKLLWFMKDSKEYKKGLKEIKDRSIDPLTMAEDMVNKINIEIMNHHQGHEKTTP